MTERTKESIRTEIEARVRTTGGELCSVGGDCYAAVLSGQTRFIVALKESRSDKKPWVGVPLPVIQMLLGQRTFLDGTPANVATSCVFIVLSHVPAKTLLVIPISSVAKVIIDRAQAGGKQHVPVQFHITKRGYRDYVIKNDPFRTDIPITIFSLEALWDCLGPSTPS